MNKKHKNSLAKTAKSLNDLKECLDLEAEQMQDTWDDKSVRYQESDKGQEEADEIEEIRDIVAGIESEITRLNELTGNELVG